MPAESWGQLLQQVGVGVGLLLLFGYGVFRAIRWIADNAIKPLIGGLIQYLQTSSKSQRRILRVQKKILDGQSELHREFRRFADGHCNGGTPDADA